MSCVTVRLTVLEYWNLIVGVLILDYKCVHDCYFLILSLFLVIIFWQLQLNMVIIIYIVLEIAAYPTVTKAWTDCNDRLTEALFLYYYSTTCVHNPAALRSQG
jgi:hypothetical protein